MTAERMIKVVTEAQDARLRDLWNWVLAYQPAGQTHRQFWAAFDERAEDLPKLAWAEGANEELRERWVDVLSLADDRGFGGLDEIQDEVM